MTPRISVIVCTYNRAAMLEGCLKSLDAQAAPKDSFEVIVVDNNSTDQTREVFERFSHAGILRLVEEKKQGLSNSRNRGTAEAHGDYVAFLDDDALAPPNYIETALRALDEHPHRIDCLGGPILPFYTDPKPSWFKDRYEIRHLHSAAHHVGKGSYFSGSNMIWHHSALQAAGGFNPNTSVKGDQLVLGGETLLIDELWQSVEHPCLYYTPELVVQHWVPPFKMTVAYRLKRFLAQGLVRGRVAGREPKGLHMGIVGSSVRSLAVGTLRFVPRIRKATSWQQVAVEGLGPLLGPVGVLLGLLHIPIRLRHRDSR